MGSDISYFFHLCTDFSLFGANSRAYNAKENPVSANFASIHENDRKKLELVNLIDADINTKNNINGFPADYFSPMIHVAV